MNAIKQRGKTKGPEYDVGKQGPLMQAMGCVEKVDGVALQKLRIQHDYLLLKAVCLYVSRLHVRLSQSVQPAICHTCQS